jgi:hypothetical protein
MNINGSSTSNFGDAWAVSSNAGNGVLVLDMGSNLSLDGLLYAQRTFDSTHLDDYGHVSIWIETTDPGAATLTLPTALGTADAEFNLLVDDNGSTLRRYDFANAPAGRYLVLFFTNGDSFFPGGQELRLFTAPDLSGDFNHDGSVDAADYVVWRKTGGTPQEYAIWRANFGRSFGSGAGAHANAIVPEPATAMSMLIAATLVMCVRHPSGVS